MDIGELESGGYHIGELDLGGYIGELELGGYM